MRIVKYPTRPEWATLMQRPLIENIEIESAVRNTLAEVKTNGDAALKKFTGDFDGVVLENLNVGEEEIQNASGQVSDQLKEAIKLAYSNIQKFHLPQLRDETEMETMPGVKCWRKNVPIENVGLYIPGGSAPLFSTVLMLAIPAKIAGCKRVALFSPPQKDGTIHPAILYTASLCGVDEMYKIGGAQAIAAMTFGTETIAPVNKIFGPGNQWVTKAKELVQTMGTAIDMPAGPSEVLIMADETSNPAFVAADLLSQAEHGPDSQVILLTTSEEVLMAVNDEIQSQLSQLPRKEVATLSLKNSFGILLDDLNTCMDFSNAYAPEHLIISTENAIALADKVINTGSVFLGKYSCESAGDYASGTNHTLPTNGYAKAYSGVSVESFLKKITFQQLDENGLQHIGPAIEIMAAAEQLDAHKNAVSIRLKSLRNEN
jgi:histidinol dehydrogenase